MARWRSIRTEIWDNDWFSSLDREGQVYWFFLLTNRWTKPSGLYRMKKGIEQVYLNASVSVTERLRKTFTEAGKAFFQGNWVLIPTFVQNQPKPNLNIWKSILQQVGKAPQPLVERWLANASQSVPKDLGKSLQSLKERFGKSLGMVGGKQVQKQVQVQVQKQKQKKGDMVSSTYTERTPGHARAKDQEQTPLPHSVSKELQDLFIKVCPKGNPIQLAEWLNELEFSEKLVKQALYETSQAGVEHPAYTKKILQTWAKEGAPEQRTGEDAKIPDGDNSGYTDEDGKEWTL